VFNVNDNHHISQSKNLEKYKNIKIIERNGINLKQMKIDGELYNIYNNIINN